MKSIDLFTSTHWISQYSVLKHFTYQLQAAFLSLGIKCRLLDLNDPEHVKLYLEDSPDCTLSFNYYGPQNGTHFSNISRIPHIFFLVDLPHRFLDLTFSPYSIITCIDRSAVGFVRASGFNQVFFLPHAADTDIIANPESMRNHDVVMLATCIDFEGIRQSWKEKFPPSLCQVMDEAAEIMLSESTIPLYQAFVAALDSNLERRASIDPNMLNGITVFDQLELYVRGKDRIELVQSITDAKVDIYSSAQPPNVWEKYVGNQPNVTIHPEVSFDQALEIMKDSKIVLNSCPSIKYGAHERIFNGLACGALVLTSQNPYLEEQFEDGMSIAFYQTQNKKNVNSIVNTYLSDPSKRIEIAKKGQQIVSQFHTWRQRAQQLINELTPIIQNLTQKNI